MRNPSFLYILTRKHAVKITHELVSKVHFLTIYCSTATPPCQIAEISPQSIPIHSFPYILACFAGHFLSIFAVFAGEACKNSKNRPSVSAAGAKSAENGNALSLTSAFYNETTNTFLRWLDKLFCGYRTGRGMLMMCSFFLIYAAEKTGRKPR